MHHFLLSWREITSILFYLFYLPLTGDPVFVALQQILLEARIECSKTELLQALKGTVSEKGFAISDNQGKGNCMFFALSEQLDLIKGIKISHDELRRAIVQHLRKNPKLVSALFFIIFRVDTFAVYPHSRHTCLLHCFKFVLKLKTIRACPHVAYLNLFRPST